MTRGAGPAVALVILAASMSGCGGGSEGLRAEAAWARPTPGGATDGVVYLRLSSDRSETLIDVRIPADVAADAELHTSDAGGGTAHQHGAAGSGQVTMKAVEEVTVSAGSTVEFRPGGNHIMLIDLVRPLELGDSFVATLRFASDRSVPVTVTVADNPPS
jgi:copper(I)-binding protein